MAWQAKNYFATRRGEVREGFLRFARKCRLGVQALYCNLLTRLCSHEKAFRPLRLLLYSHCQLWRKFYALAAVVVRTKGDRPCAVKRRIMCVDLLSG